MMNPQPPSGPEPPITTAPGLADELIQLSREILTLSTNPSLPELGQLILRRGRLMDELAALPLDCLPPAGRQAVQDKLVICRKMDEAIEKNLTGIKDQLATQLKGLKSSHALMEKYRATMRDTLGTHTEEA